MSPHRRALLVVVAAAATAVLASTPPAAMAAAAQPDESAGGGAAVPATLTVSPSVIDLEVKPGDRIERDVSITARGSAALDVQFEHADFGFTKDTYAPTFIEDDQPETTRFSTRGWFSVPQARFQLSSGQTRQVRLTVTVPENVEPGTHLGAAFFEASARGAGDGAAQVRTTLRTGPLVLIEVAGGTPARPRLQDLDLPAVVERAPIEVPVVVRNDGDAYLRMSGTVKLVGPGRDDTVELPGGVVVPGTPRVLPGRDGDARVGRRKMTPGRYEVQVRLVTDPGQRIVRDTAIVWILPWWLRITAAAGLALLLGGVALGVLRVRRRRHVALLASIDEHDVSEASDDDEIFAADDDVEDDDSEPSDADSERPYS